MELDAFLARLDGVRHQPTGISARCPAHDDHKASLTVNVGREGGLVVYCHANCPTENVMAALGLTMADLAGEPHVVEVYGYNYPTGELKYEIDRWHPKDFRVRPAGLPASERLPYHADHLARARQRGQTIHIFEGERDCDRGVALGLVGTTNPFGAGKWLPHFSPHVAGCPVVIVADNDEAGFRHAREVAASVRDFASSVSLVHPRYGKDFSDLIDAGWTLNELDPLPEANLLESTVVANVIIKPIHWAWNGMIPFGKVVLIEGDPGDGKSVLTVDLAARWSSGQVMPDNSTHGGPYKIIMVTAEDDVEDTVAPRLRTAGANLSLIQTIDHGTVADQPFTIARDMPELRRIVLDSGARIVILDPLSAFLGSDVDSHNDASVRAGLYPLYRLARDTGVAVVAVRHLNKGSGAKALYRGGGSIGFIGMARAAYTVGRDPEEPEKRVMACTKMNIAPMPPSLSYSVKSAAGGPFLEWHGIVDLDAQTVLDGDAGPSTKEIVQFLNGVVQNGEPMSWAAIVEAGEKYGFTEKQLRYRRGQSKLVKIKGEAGNRSTRWGYREHLLATESIYQETAISPTSHHLPVFQGWGTGGERATGQPDPTLGLEANGENGGPVGSDGHVVNEDPLTVEEAKDLALDALPLVCQICGAEENVSRWGRPYWAVRCLPHNPRTFRSGS